MKAKIRILCALFLALSATSIVSAADSAAKIKVLLITGGHDFEKEPFYRVFQENPEISFTPVAHKGTNADAFERDDLLSYNVIVLYDIRRSITEEQKAKFLSLFDKGIGLVVLHHALVSYQHWPEYERIIGGRYPEEDGKYGAVTPQVGWEHDHEVPIVIVAKDHPITAGVEDFTIHDEIYWGFHVQPDVTTLITTTLPKSGKPLAWCRAQGKSRVVYFQLGHDHSAYDNPNYRRLLANGIRWAANR